MGLWRGVTTAAEDWGRRGSVPARSTGTGAGPWGRIENPGIEGGRRGHMWDGSRQLQRRPPEQGGIETAEPMLPSPGPWPRAQQAVR